MTEKKINNGALLVLPIAFGSILLAIFLFTTFPTGAILFYIGIVIVPTTAFLMALDIFSKKIGKQLLVEAIAIFIGSFWILEHIWLSWVLPYAVMTTFIDFVMILMLAEAALLGILFLENR